MLQEEAVVCSRLEGWGEVPGGGVRLQSSGDCELVNQQRPLSPDS